MSGQSSKTRMQERGTHVRVTVVVRAVRVGVVVRVLVGSARAIVAGAIVVALERYTSVRRDMFQRPRNAT